MEEDLVELLMIKDGSGKPTKQLPTASPSNQQLPPSATAATTGPVDARHSLNSSTTSSVVTHRQNTANTDGFAPQPTSSYFRSNNNDNDGRRISSGPSLQERLLNLGAEGRMSFHPVLGPPVSADYGGFPSTEAITERHVKEFQTAQNQMEALAASNKVEWDPFFGPPVRKGAKGSSRPEPGSKPKRAEPIKIPQQLAVAPSPMEMMMLQQQQIQQQQQQQQIQQNQYGYVPPNATSPIDSNNTNQIGIGTQPQQQPQQQQQQFPPQVIEFAKYVTVDPATEQYLLPLAGQMMQSPLPPIWRPVRDPASGRTYFVNVQTQATTWDHPLKQDFVKRIEVERANYKKTEQEKSNQSQQQQQQVIPEESKPSSSVASNANDDHEIKTELQSPTSLGHSGAATAGTENNIFISPSNAEKKPMNPIMSKLKRAATVVTTQNKMKSDAENSQFATAASSALFSQMKEKQSGSFKLTSDDEDDDLLGDKEMKEVKYQSEKFVGSGVDEKSRNNQETGDLVVTTSGVGYLLGEGENKKQNRYYAGEARKNEDSASSSEDDEALKEKNKAAIDFLGEDEVLFGNGESKNNKKQEKQEKKAQKHLALKNHLAAELGELAVPNHTPRVKHNASATSKVNKNRDPLLDSSADDDEIEVKNHYSNKKHESKQLAFEL